MPGSLIAWTSVSGVISKLCLLLMSAAWAMPELFCHCSSVFITGHLRDPSIGSYGATEFLLYSKQASIAESSYVLKWKTEPIYI